MALKKKQEPNWLLDAMEMAVVKGERLWAHGQIEAVEGLTAEQAAWKPRKKGMRSIWEIVDHVAFWKDAMVRVLEERPLLDSSKHKGWPPITDRGEAAWAMSVKNLKKQHKAFMKHMETLDPKLMDKSLPKSKLKLGHNIYGVLVHDAYHTGQIIQLRQMQGLGLDF